MTFNELSENCPNWQPYIQHEFVRGIGDGSLARPAFQYYLQQDYLFLIQFTRAWGLGVYKSQSLQDMRAAQTGINAMLDTEIALHIDYCREWGISESKLEQLDEHPATVAYTRYVLDCGLAGTLADLHVALAPCVIGYAVIGKWLSSQDWLNMTNNPYQAWIKMYTSDDYQQAATTEIHYLNELCAEKQAKEKQHLQRIFNTATNMEIAFWQMGLDHENK